IRRAQRLRAEQDLRVREDELLVLLFVVQAELEPIERVGVEALLDERRQDPAIDGLAIRVDAMQLRPRHEAAALARHARAERLVVAVEQERGLAKERALGGGGAEDDRLEEPRGVREVPLRRAGVARRLDLVILGGERRAQRERSPADVHEATGEYGGVRGHR